MIVLDTNVLSEPLKADADASVVRWMDRQDIDSLYITTINLVELLVGLEIMPCGRRRSTLQTRLAEVLDTFDDSRILPFDVPAARLFAVLVARARVAGSAISVADGQIAAIAAAKGFAVATRDAEPFIAAGVPIINPWDSP
jgi:toxin FitB